MYICFCIQNNNFQAIILLFFFTEWLFFLTPLPSFYAMCYNATKDKINSMEVPSMHNQKPELRFLHSHCVSDMFYFGNFSSKGSDYHCHVDFYEFCLVVSGSYLNTCRNIETVLEVGDLFFFKAGESHELTANSPNSNHYSIIIKDSYFQEYCKKHMDNVELIFSTPYMLKKLSGSEFAYLTHLASAIVRSASAKKLPIVNLFLFNVLFSCFESIPDTTDNTVQIYAIDLLRRFDSYQILQREVSAIYNDYPISSTALIRDFKKLTGYTIIEYRNMKRMEYAAHLLKEENYSITVIANMLNISSLGYFSKQFRKQYGLTPKQYQLLHRKNTD